MPVPLPPEINPLTPEKKPLLSDPSPLPLSKQSPILKWFLLPLPGFIALVPFSSGFNFFSWFLLFIAFLICIFNAYWIAKISFKKEGIALYANTVLLTIVICLVNAAFSFPLGCCMSFQNIK